jgi:hypothetical protein
MSDMAAHNFAEFAEFFDVEGMPVTIAAGAPVAFCAAWDSWPPRPFDPSSARRNGTPIDAEKFRAMLELSGPSE